MDGWFRDATQLAALTAVSVLAAPVHAESNVTDVGQVESHGTVIHPAAKADSAQVTTTVVETIFPVSLSGFIGNSRTTVQPAKKSRLARGR